jgi:hypothetical protein
LYDVERFDGLPRNLFLEAVRAEGAPIGVGAHGRPIYQNPLFESMNFGRTGCPVRCPLYGKPLDFSQVSCPQAEHVYANVALSIPHAAFLGDRSDMDLILESIRKVRANTDELRGRAVD